LDGHQDLDNTEDLFNLNRSSMSHNYDAAPAFFDFIISEHYLFNQKHFKSFFQLC
jgi:hypothetical protein